MAIEFQVLRKAGALRNGNERGQGTVWHIVKADDAYCGPALCGQQPAIQWTDGDAGKVASCPTCIRRLNAIADAA